MAITSCAPFFSPSPCTMCWRCRGSAAAGLSWKWSRATASLPESDERARKQVRRSPPESRIQVRRNPLRANTTIARVFRLAQTAPVGCGGTPALPAGRENLVWRAIEAMRRELNYRGGIHARLSKQIPVARGLGGGWSDAATAIIGMLRLTGRELPLPRAMEIGADLGADVPFSFSADARWESAAATSSTRCPMDPNIPSSSSPQRHLRQHPRRLCLGFFAIDKAQIAP